MTYVIVNEEGQLYGGFDSEKSRPIWFKTMREGCGMPESIADAAMKQLAALGFSKIVKRNAGGVIRKWVPADLDATKV
jgi:hypothetical protein